MFFGAAVKGRCMEDLLGSLLLTTVSQNGPNISPRGVEMPQLNAALMSALESVEWFVLRPSFFVLDRSKSIPITIGGQTAWEAVRNDFIENKEKIASKDYELHGRCAVLFC